MRRQGNGRLVVALAMAFLLSAQIAAASSFGLAPLGLSISSRESSGSIVAQNNGDDTIVLQVKTLRWTQREGKDVREETRDLLANPPIFKLGPGEQQLVRFAQRTGAPAEYELAYRAIFTEVPPEVEPQSSAAFRISLAMDVPVYVEPVARVEAQPAIRWRAERSANGLQVFAENPGNMHYRVTAAEFGTFGKILHKQGILVVLPKSTLVISMPPPPPTATLIQLSAVDGENLPVTFEIPLPAAP
jgi:fimbrial chaperone protein